MLEQLERPETQEQLAVPRLEIAPPAPAENDQRQRRRMVIALVMLLVALGLVLVKDRDFWFEATDTADSEAVEDSTPADVNQPTAIASTTAAATAPATPAGTKRAHPAPAASHKPTVPAAVAAGPVVTATRAVLPPLRVEVVAGDRRQLVRPGSPSVSVDLQPGTAAQSAPDPSQAGTEMASAGTAVPVTNAGDRVQMSTDTRQALSRPVRPEYPLLARQMKVQGAVVLDVRIGKDGGIQSLQVSSGPAILADAAREAVKQWRFKPYFQDGQPVETQARVTVDFTIRAN
jgi:TonB family protein